MLDLDTAALAARLPPSPRTRFAPSPTGYLHLGHVVNAIAVWGLARLLGGRVLLRLETHDRGRCRPEYARATLEDLAWLGFEPDEGPVDQTDDTPYAAAIETLRGQGLVYACACSRRSWSGEGRYAGHCRDRGLADGPDRALRLRVPAGEETWTDGTGATARGDASQPGGDIILRDRDGRWSYHLAVTADDQRQAVDLVVRGADLTSATAVQVHLGRLLGRETPAVYVHHPLILRPDGRKLSKSGGDTGVREWRARGASPEEVIGLAAHGAGLIPAPRPVGAPEAAALIAPGSGRRPPAGILG